MKLRKTAALLLLILTLLPVRPAFCEEALPLQGVTIGIDPGHQLIYDPDGEPVAPGSSRKKQKVAGGCRGIRSRVYEYEVNLNVGLYLRDLLTEAGAEVVLTHDVLRVNISNKQRAELFNAHEVDLGIRLHCNNADRQAARGGVMLVPDKKHAGTHFVSDIFIGLTVLDHYIEVTGLPRKLKKGFLEFRDDQAGFNWCTRPVVCLEMGYLSNPEDDRLLSDPAFQQKMAQGIFEGICACFDETGTLKIR